MFHCLNHFFKEQLDGWWTQFVLDYHWEKVAQTTTSSGLRSDSSAAGSWVSRGKAGLQGPVWKSVCDARQKGNLDFIGLTSCLSMV